MAPRFVLAALVVAAACLPLKPVATRREIAQGVLISVFATVATLLQNDGLRFTEASTSAFLTQFYAILIPVWLSVRRRRPPGMVVAVCCLLVLAGVAILGRFDWRHMTFGRGELETLLCSVFFMGQILWLDSPAFAGNRPLPVTAAMFAVSAVSFAAFGWAAAPSAAVWLRLAASPAWLGMTIALTVLCTIFAFLLMNRWQPRLTATEAGLIYCFEPIFGSLFALFLPALLSAWAVVSYANESLTWRLLAGGGLITAANLLIQWKPPPKHRP